MKIRNNVPLGPLTTMHLGTGAAKAFADIDDVADIEAVYDKLGDRSMPVFVLGGGSNVIARDQLYPGLVLRMRIPGFEVIADTPDSTTIKIGAGEIWDDVVRRTVEMQLGGIEGMSGIPGTAGAAPVQNIGAYGQEVAETLLSLEAYDTQTHQLVTLQNADCGFTYRHSAFRGELSGRYIITSITLRLNKTLPQPPFYDSLQAYFDAHDITTFTHQTVRDGVLAVRTNKLPDPSVTPNAGSFFKNAIVGAEQYDELKARYPELKAYEMGDHTYKLYTGWLIENAGLKEQLLHGIRVHDKNCLVLKNESANTYADLAQARDEIDATIRDLYQVHIDQEPLEIA